MTMKAVLAIACGTFVLATSAIAQTATTTTSANSNANAATAAQVGAQMTTCDQQAKANAAINPRISSLAKLPHPPHSSAILSEGSQSR